MNGALRDPVNHAFHHSRTQRILWVLWILWVGVFVAGALRTRGIPHPPTLRRGTLRSLLSEIAHATPIGAILEIRRPSLDTALLSAVRIPLGPLMTVSGIAFSFWARFALHRNLRGVAMIHPDHERVSRGPDHLLHHPIYAGLQLAFAGSVAPQSATQGAPIKGIVIGPLPIFLIQIGCEERGLEAALGDRFTRFPCETRALFPSLGWRPDRSTQR